MNKDFYNKPKIVYILGYGHTGSTILNKILGGSNNVISLGEVLFIKNRLIGIGRKKGQLPQRKCTCGIDLYDCKLWGNILSDIDTSKIYYQNLGFFLTLKVISNIFFGYPKIDISNLNDKDLYNSIIQNAQNIYSQDIDTVVDSSKDFRRFLYLLKNPEIDLHVIFLIRDGRGVINSMAKKGSFWRKFWFKTYVIWFFWNLFSGILYKKVDNDKKLMISYDKFAQQPDKYLQQIKDKFGVELDMQNYLDNANKQEIHYIGGNSMQRKDITEIKHDEKRRKTMPKRKQIITTVFCYIPNKIWVWNKKL